MDLTTLARVKRLLDPSMGVSNDGELTSIVTATSMIFERYLDRHVERIARTEYFDVEEGQLWVHLKGYPVTVLTSVANDTAVPPTWATLLANTDYLLYPEERYHGKLRFVTTLAGGPRALRVIYTGGMAGATTQAASQNGVNGATVVLGNLFVSATGLFLTNGIMPGDILTITGGANAGAYTVQAVQSNTTLIINPLTPWPAAPSAGETWAVTSQVAGFLALYPVVAKAADIQAAFYWRNRDKFGLMSMGVGGGNVAFNTLRPLDLTYGASGLITEVQTMLQPYRSWVAS